MTNEEILRIRDLCNRATPGPWKRDLVEELDDERGSCQSAIVCEADPYNEIVTCDSGVYGPYGADAELIAECRMIIPALLDALEEERRKVGRAFCPDCAEFFLYDNGPTVLRIPEHCLECTRRRCEEAEALRDEAEDLRAYAEHARSVAEQEVEATENYREEALDQLSALLDRWHEDPEKYGRCSSELGDLVDRLRNG